MYICIIIVKANFSSYFVLKNKQCNYLNAILSKPRAQKVILFSITWVIGIKNDVAISTIKFTNIFFGQWSFGTAIDAPYLYKIKCSRMFSSVIILKHFERRCLKSIGCTSIFPPPSSKGGTSSFTGVLFVMPLRPTPCCFSKASKTKRMINKAS